MSIIQKNPGFSARHDPEGDSRTLFAILETRLRCCDGSYPDRKRPRRDVCMHVAR